MVFSSLNHLSTKKFALYSAAVLCCVASLSCSNRKQPAPVTEIYQGKTFRDFQQDGYSASTYRVKAGDTLFSIAWYSGNDYRDLAKINRISPPYQINAGQVLSLRKPAKNQPRQLNSKTGQTSETITNQAVDHSKKQAYGEGVQNLNKGSFEPPIGQFPYRVKSWQWPTSEAISRHFSAKEQGNKGLDFSGRLGTPILAAADGKVVYTGAALRGFGKLIIIKHNDAFLTAYAHNDNILVKEQQWVKANQKIATMGSSGTNKVKLHFEVRYKGKSIDPLRYLPRR